MNKFNVHEVQEASDDYSNRKIKIFGFQNARRLSLCCDWDFLLTFHLYTPS